MTEYCTIEETPNGKFLVYVSAISEPYDTEEEAEEVASCVDEDLMDLFGESS